MLGPRLLSVLLAVCFLAPGCRLDPECFGAGDCFGGFVCSRGFCVQPDAAVDTGVPRDAGFLNPDVGFAMEDTGVAVDAGFPDLGFPDAARPDLGYPDAGLGDVGFLAATMPSGVDPVVGTSTPALVRGGFSNLQSVTWLTATAAILLADVDEDALYLLDPLDKDAISIREAPTGEAVGTAIDPLFGDVLICEQFRHQLRRIPQLSGNGPGVTVIDNFYSYDFNSPNDVAIHTDGTVYFTDPPFGLNGRLQELPFNGLFRFSSLTGDLTVEWMGVPGQHVPDGVALSPDQTRVYLTEVVGNVIVVFDRNINGDLVNRRGFALPVGLTPNGIAVDFAGNVYVGTSLGIEVYAATGYFWGIIPMPGPVSDLAFGPDRRLFATTTSSVFKLDVAIDGPLR